MQKKLQSQTSDKKPAQKLAWRSAGVILLFLAITVAGLAGDLVSKHYAFESVLRDENLPEKVENIQNQYRDKLTSIQLLGMIEKKPLAPGVKITLSLNPGIVFSWSMPPLIVHIATGLTIILVIGIFATSSIGAKSIHISLALILGGALGNWYDRAFSAIQLPGTETIKYHVRDFIDCSELYYPYVFNVADILLVLGVAIMILTHIVAMVRELRTSKTGKNL